MATGGPLIDSRGRCWARCSPHHEVGCRALGWQSLNRVLADISKKSAARKSTLTRVGGYLPSVETGFSQHSAPLKKER